MAATAVEYASASLATERGRMGRSLAIWAGGGGRGFGVLRTIENTNNGMLFGSNFMAWVGGAVASNKNNYSTEEAPFHSWEGTGASVTTIANDRPVGVTGSLNPPAVGLALGTIELNTSATQFKAVVLEAAGSANGANTNGMFGLPNNATATAPAAGQLPKVFFETRLRFPQAANMSMFVGLSAPGASASDTVVFSGASAYQKQSAIGFAITPVASTGFATSGIKIQPFYSTGTASTVASATSTTFLGNTGGIPNTAAYPGTAGADANTTANTLTSLSTDWTKIGFVVDAADAAGQVLRFYQDGILLASQTLTQIVAANWPSNVDLSPVICVQCATAAADKLDVDWAYWGTILNVE